MRRINPLCEANMPLILVGLPGAGKTTVARELARLTHSAHIDSDSEVKRAMRKSISRIFAENGEPFFRRLEEKTIKMLVENHPAVISLGGGAVKSSATRKLLEGHNVVYLRVSPAEAARRVYDNDQRPLLAVQDQSELLSRMEELAVQRTPFYEQTASFTIDVDQIPAAEIAQQILLHFGIEL